MHDTLVLISIVLRGLSVLACIGGTVFLIYHDRNGWGWLIFLAIILGSYSLIHKPDQPVQVKQSTILDIK